MNKIHIQCGIKDEASGDNQNNFWPVLQAVPLTYLWSPPKNQAYSIIFTSKIAVKLFSQWNEIKNVEHICAVGKQTAEFIEKSKELFPFIQFPLSPVLFPKTEGLSHLFNQFKFSLNSFVYIFTALNGKTENTLQQISQQSPLFRPVMIPVYQLETLRENFLDILFLNKNEFQNMKFIFQCRSGMVLRTAVEKLKHFFSCKDISNLPACITFSVDLNKPSIKYEIQALDLIDRISS